MLHHSRSMRASARPRGPPGLAHVRPRLLRGTHLSARPLPNAPQLGMVYSTKSVFYKHRDANFFPSLSYATGLLVSGRARWRVPCAVSAPAGRDSLRPSVSI